MADPPTTRSVCHILRDRPKGSRFLRLAREDNRARFIWAVNQTGPPNDVAVPPEAGIYVHHEAASFKICFWAILSFLGGGSWLTGLARNPAGHAWI
jgi:hypothetical protein